LPEIKNPNLQTQGSGGGSGSGGDMRSTLAFTMLMLVVLLGYQYFFKAKPATPAALAQTQSQAETAAAPNNQAGQVSAALPAGSAQAAAATPAIAAALETQTTVENEKFRIVFTNRGAQVEHWILLDKHYRDRTGPEGKQLDMVNSKAAPFERPLSFFTYEPALTRELNQDALYQVTTSGATSAAGTLMAPCKVTFRFVANGLDVVKTFSFDSSYVIKVETEVKRNGAPVRALVEWPAGLGDQTDAIQYASGKFLWSIDGKDGSTDAKKVSGNATSDQPYEYAAISDLYFAAAFLPDSPATTTAVTLHSTVEMPSDANDPNSQKRKIDVIGLAVGDSSGATRLRLFAGPKETDILKAIHATGADGKPTGPTLEPIIQFGMWAIIAKPLYLALRFLHGMLGSGPYTWGWAIIIVTVIFNLLMLPTRFMMMKSSLKMMRIQPKVEALKKRYAHLKMNDPKKAEMNTEMMALYKTEGVNMYGGCLPMLIQMPLFFAYYRVLLNAVELRQAPWFWLTDLSAPDPMYILPILIIVSMFLVQFLTPSPGMDASQRRMMAFLMPVIFGFSMLHFASGLALYWGTGNVINLGIQLIINQSPMGKEMHAIAAKRAAKKAGTPPKTLQGKR
jgi:YidC/Oxa1 family membrane protein insertase